MNLCPRTGARQVRDSPRETMTRPYTRERDPRVRSSSGATYSPLPSSSPGGTPSPYVLRQQTATEPLTTPSEDRGTSARRCRPEERRHSARRCRPTDRPGEERSRSPTDRCRREERRCRPTAEPRGIGKLREIGRGRALESGERSGRRPQDRPTARRGSYCQIMEWYINRIIYPPFPRGRPSVFPCAPWVSGRHPSRPDGSLASYARTCGISSPLCIECQRSLESASDSLSTVTDH